MDSEVLMKVLVLYVGGGFSLLLGIIAYKIMRINKYDYKKNHERSGLFFDALRGNVSTYRNGGRDHHVAAGLGVDLKTNEWVEQGTLSEESLDTILR